MQSYQRQTTTTSAEAPLPTQILRTPPAEPEWTEEEIEGPVWEPPAAFTEPNALQSEDPEVREPALRVLRGMTGVLDGVAERKRKVDGIMAELLHETRQLRVQRQKKRLRQLTYAGLFVAILFMTKGHLGFYWWIFMSGGGAAAADNTAWKRRLAAQALGQADEPRAVGVLALAVSEDNAAIREAAYSALLRLLPRVQASDAAYIDNEQMLALLALADTHDPRMQIALLKGLEQIGDGRALPVVEGLTVTGIEPVRQKALECLPYLQERSQRAILQATLLRGVCAPPTEGGGEQLLRPVSGPITADPPEQLLRATSDRTVE